MINMFGFIVQVLLLTVTIAFLGARGIVKQQRKTEELLSKIYLDKQGTNRDKQGTVH